MGWQTIADTLPSVQKPHPSSSIRYKTTRNGIFEKVLPSQLDDQKIFERLALSPPYSYCDPNNHIFKISTATKGTNMARNPNTNSRGDIFDVATIETVWKKGGN